MLQNETYILKWNDLNRRTSNLGFLCPMIRYEVWPHTWEGITFHPCCSLLFCRSLPRAPFISQEPLWKRTVSSTEWKPLKTKCKFPVLVICWWLYLTIRLFNTTFALHVTSFFIDAAVIYLKPSLLQNSGKILKVSYPSLFQGCKSR